MADSSEISSLYPPPPPYYRFFTTENVQKYNELRKGGASDEEISNIHDIKFLVHPQHPEKEQYRSFGDLWWFEDKQVGLKESGIQQIYGDPEDTTKDGEENETQDEEEVFTQTRIDELKKMTKSLLLNFLELVGLLSKNPKLASVKIDNIRTILINIHHLLNSYRLHQSRETLILTMQKKLTETQESIEEIKDTCLKVESKLDLLVEKLQSVQTSQSEKEETKEENDTTKEIYTIPKELWEEATTALAKQQN